MELNNIISKFLPWSDSVHGIIITIVSFVILTFFKIMETAREMAKTRDESEKLFSGQTESFLDLTYAGDKNQNIHELHFHENSEPDVESENSDDQVEIANIPDNSTIAYIPSVKSAGIKSSSSEAISPDHLFEHIKREHQDDPEIENLSFSDKSRQIPSGALREIFNKKLNNLTSRLGDLKQKRFPFYTLKNGIIQRFFLNDRRDIVIEELFELWRMGYQHPALPEIFVHYFFSIKSAMANKVLKSILFQENLDGSTQKRILFYYQDILSCKVSDHEIISDYSGNPENLFCLKLSLDIHRGIKLTRKLWNEWENLFLHDVHEDRKGEFFLFFYELLQKNISFIVHYLLIHRYKHVMTSQWRIFIERQAFYHGHFEKLSLLTFMPPEYACLITKTPEESQHIRSDLLTMLRKKPFFELHCFLAHYINFSQELDTFEIDYGKVNQYLKNLELVHTQSGFMPQAIRFILYLYFYQKKDFQKINFMTPYIHGKVGKFIPKLYHVRLLFRNRQYEDAWNEINQLWDQDEENLLLMNEAAVYAYHSGRMKEAEQLFGKMLALYPDNVQVLHNKALFLQRKARLVMGNDKISESNSFHNYQTR
ncbi:MAG: tetratricopeptide repeat protein [Spirochaetia bacterium]|nr:tetratricopeptide repeat protein [Spirochaetia bacterium]